MINSITNRNLKRLLSKGKLSPELLMELKTSLFIHPSRKADDGGYYFTYCSYGDGEILPFFTSYDEFLKCYGRDCRLEPVFWYLDAFEDDIYADTRGVIINPGSDRFFIASSVFLHILCDIETNNSSIVRGLFPPRTFERNDFLYRYLRGKKSFRQLANLFSYLDSSVVYTLITSETDLGEGEIELKDNHYSFFKIDSYYVLYTEKDLMKNDIRKDEHFYYMVGDAVEVMKLALEFDFEGIILKTPEGDFTIERKSLLKQYESIIRNYQKRENSHEFAYSAGDLFV